MFQDGNFLWNDPKQRSYQPAGNDDMIWEDAIVTLDLTGMSEIFGLCMTIGLCQSNVSSPNPSVATHLRCVPDSTYTSVAAVSMPVLLAAV